MDVHPFSVIGKMECASKIQLFHTEMWKRVYPSSISFSLFIKLINTNLTNRGINKMPTAAELYRQKVAGHKDPRMKSEGEFNIQYPSGFLTLDFANGCKVNVTPHDGNPPFSYYSIGITDGAAFELVGKPGCGKTTLAIQIAARITERFEWSSIFHDDIEGGVSEVRKRVLTGWSEEMMEEKYRYRNTGITSENFYESITTLKDVKLANKDSIMYDTGMYDYHGNRVMKMQPDVYILDSAAMLIPEKFSEEEELSGSMSSTAAAKSNTISFKRIIPQLKACNIILIMINHINDDVSFMPKKPDLAWLKVGETIPGGRIFKYLPNLIIRLDENTKLKEEKDLGVNGIIVDAVICKSRTGRAGRVCQLVFDYDRGFDNDLSLFITLRAAKLITNSGAYFTLAGYPDMKFTQKGFVEKLHTDAEFATAFKTVALEYLKGMINTDDTLAFAQANSKGIANDILADLNAGLIPS